jgi:hypothetical protein
VSCRWLFFEKVEIAPGVFDQFSLIAVDRIPAVQSIFQSVTDGFLPVKLAAIARV